MHERFWGQVLSQAPSSFFTLLEPREFGVDFGIPEVDWIRVLIWKRKSVSRKLHPNF
jgi:hypothetical protein